MYTKIQHYDILHNTHCMYDLARQENCPIGWFVCNNTHCVPNSQVCDNVDDCGDSSDEWNCWARRRRGLLLKKKRLYMCIASTMEFLDDRFWYSLTPTYLVMNFIFYLTLLLFKYNLKIEHKTETCQFIVFVHLSNNLLHLVCCATFKILPFHIRAKIYQNRPTQCVSYSRYLCLFCYSYAK